MKAIWDLACLPDIPTFFVASFVAKENLFNDKSDVYRGACNLNLASLKDLSYEVLRAMDPLSKDGVVSLQVKKYISSLNKRLVSEELAIKDWKLSNDDLAKLCVQKKPGGATFYRLKDVRRASAIKHQENTIALLEKVFPGANERIAQLLSHLSKHNVPIRLDSTACVAFITKGVGNPDEIARRLKEMDFYHTYTDYKNIFDYYTDKYRVEYGYYDRDHISSDAKALALASFLKKNPDKIYLVPESLKRFCEHKL